VSELTRAFEFGVNDGMLSVLPLHHTFEFSAGLLMPLARGAQITYLAELNGEAISSALEKGHVTAIVGVPALWELLRRRVMQKLSDRSPLLEPLLKAVSSANYKLRAGTGIDLGMLLFFPVHAGFGGRIRYLISGGSALSPDVLKTFYGMGFNFYEGYGLTETAPVLSVTSAAGKPLPGSVGKPLPGVEVKIDNPDASGVGEVVTRGRNLMLGYWQDEEATRAAIRDGWFHTGDLGRFDEEGNLYIVGRSKEVIIDSNGKNVYPDEIEELYRKSPYVKELSVVGLPEGGAEQVAGAVVPNLEHEPALSRAEVIAKIDEHLQGVSSGLPFWKRIKTLEYWETDLPKTAKRSIKRREIVAEMQRRKSSAVEASDGAGKAEGGVAWFLDIIAAATGKPRSEIHLQTRVSALGFDSLAYNELAEGVEAAGITVPEQVDFTAAQDVAGLLALCTKGRPAGGSRRERRSREAGELLRDDDIRVPDPLARLGKGGIGLFQKLFFQQVMDTKVEGALHIPSHTHFVVAANHCSHLDMGAIKVALGEAGRDLASLAAADYFFSDRWRRAYFSNFTNLVPMERVGSIRKSMDIAERVLRQGKSLVVFPEGGRSTTGQMKDFLPSLGYLALKAGSGILPAHIAGSHEALPKGSAIPRSRELRVRFGPFLSVDFLGTLTEGLPQQEAWRLCAAFTQRIVEHLRDGKAVGLDAAAVRAAWDGARLGPLSRTAAVRPNVPGSPPVPRTPSLRLSKGGGGS
jgi:long-chain acyl-CoA synthetase